MDAEYGKLALRIAAAYPSSFIGDLTLADWTERLAEVDLDHASRMTNVLRNLPSPPDPWDWQRARRDTAEIEYVRALPSGPPEEMSPEDRERWEALKAKLRDRPPGRSFPAALLEVPDADIEPKFRLRRDMVCSGSGEYAEIIDGVPCCPGCKEPLPGRDTTAAASPQRGG